MKKILKTQKSTEGKVSSPPPNVQLPAQSASLSNPSRLTNKKEECPPQERSGSPCLARPDSVTPERESFKKDTDRALLARNEKQATAENYLQKPNRKRAKTKRRGTPLPHPLNSQEVPLKRRGLGEAEDVLLRSNGIGSSPHGYAKKPTLQNTHAVGRTR